MGRDTGRIPSARTHRDAPETHAGMRGSHAENGTARALIVNRTHRVVRDQALRMQEQRHRSRGLFAPLGICSALLLVICYAIWAVLAGYDLTPTGIPDASDQVMLLLLLWSLPVTAVALGLVWFRRGRGSHESFGGPRS